MAVSLLGLLGVLGGLAAVLIIFGSPLGGFLEHHSGLSAGAFGPLWTVVRIVASVVLAALMGTGLSPRPAAKISGVEVAERR